MKMIVAIIRPERLEAVEDALKKVLDEGDHYRITVDTVEGHGRQEGEVEIFHGMQIRVRRVQRSRVTLVVNDAYLEKSIDAIVKGAPPCEKGAIGDEKVFVVSLEECVRIRAGERGGQAV